MSVKVPTPKELPEYLAGVQARKDNKAIEDCPYNILTLDSALWLAGLRNTPVLVPWMAQC
jgi:ribosome modulation factor